MSDRTDLDEERYLRRVGRRMKVHPEALLRQLQLPGFILLNAARDFGANDLEFLRPTPGVPGFFDILKPKSNVRPSAILMARTGVCSVIIGSIVGNNCIKDDSWIVRDDLLKLT